jgi:hypothetical protein
MRQEEIGDRHSGSSLDLLVGVEKGEAQPLGEPSADRRLSSAHHAHKDDGLPRRKIRRVIPRFARLAHGGKM